MEKMEEQGPLRFFHRSNSERRGHCLVNTFALAERSIDLPGCKHSAHSETLR